MFTLIRDGDQGPDYSWFPIVSIPFPVPLPVPVPLPWSVNKPLLTGAHRTKKLDSVHTELWAIVIALADIAKNGILPIFCTASAFLFSAEFFRDGHIPWSTVRSGYST